MLQLSRTAMQYGMSLPYGSTCHPSDRTQVNTPCLNPRKTQFTYPRGMEGWVDLHDM